MHPLQELEVCSTFSSHGQSSSGRVVVTTTCATSPLSQITSKTKQEEAQKRKAGKKERKTKEVKKEESETRSSKK